MKLSKNEFRRAIKALRFYKRELVENAFSLTKIFPKTTYIDFVTFNEGLVESQLRLLSIHFNNRELVFEILHQYFYDRDCEEYMLKSFIVGQKLIHDGELFEYLKSL